MNSRPIIFNTEMVRAILSGRKTQTRRPVKPQPVKLENIKYARVEIKDEMGHWFGIGLGIGTTPICSAKRPYQPGDTLWVRETFWRERYYKRGILQDEIFGYRADGKNPEVKKWRPSIHMPREASRITLRITGARVERLQDISEEDAKAEGFCDHPTGIIIPNSRPPQRAEISYVDWFKDLWERINKKRQGLTWNDNPWVWVIEFERA